jgi:hypothetical protein
VVPSGVFVVPGSSRLASSQPRIAVRVLAEVRDRAVSRAVHEGRSYEIPDRRAARLELRRALEAHVNPNARPTTGWSWPWEI